MSLIEEALKKQQQEMNGTGGGGSAPAAAGPPPVPETAEPPAPEAPAPEEPKPDSRRKFIIGGGAALLLIVAIYALQSMKIVNLPFPFSLLGGSSAAVVTNAPPTLPPVKAQAVTTPTTATATVSGTRAATTAVVHITIPDEPVVTKPGMEKGSAATAAPAATPVAQSKPAVAVATRTNTPVVVGAKKGAAPRVAIAEPAPWPTLSLTGIIASDGPNGSALINGQLVNVGETVEGAKILSISRQGVRLSYNGQVKLLKIGGVPE